ncbi:hypothetical protein HDU96_010158 [Phlyctochytrium bullatum]|nr:hypothetical protein HDU96_010158 [Phlyctochytrium bullatum]
MKEAKDFAQCLAFEQGILENLWDHMRKVPHEMDITRKSYSTLILREVLICAAAKNAAVWPLYIDHIPHGTAYTTKLRDKYADLKKEIKDMLLVGAKDDNFDKKMANIVEKSQSMTKEELTEYIPALKATLDDKVCKEIGAQFMKEKKLAQKTEPMLTDFPMTFDELIIKDHILVKKLFQDFKKADSMEYKSRLANKIIQNISLHSFSEEVTIYPLYEKHFENGKAIADASRHEHQAVKKDASLIEGMRNTSQSAGFLDMMDKLEKDFNEHGEHEETRELPTLLSILTREDAIKVGEKFDANKSIAPTHPHPSAPDSGGITQKLAGMATVPIDKLRDAMARD